MTLLGFLLVLITLAVAVAIGTKANRSVRTYDEQSHEQFVGSMKE